MKKLVALFAAVAFVTGMVGFAAAQKAADAPKAADTKAGDTKAADTKATDTKAPAKTAKAKTKSASGNVKSASADSIVVAGKEKGKEAEWTFGVDPSTKITKGGKSVTAADLAAGDHVSVKYSEKEGKMVASSVSARAGKTAKADTKAPATAPAEKK